MSTCLAIVIGMGEVGEPLWKMLVEAFGANNVKGRDIKPEWEGYSFQFMHICFPQDVNFTKTVLDYIEKYKAKQVFIHSTVSPGTTRILQAGVIKRFPEHPIIYFTPVNGNTRDGMEWGLKTYVKYLSPAFPSLKDLWPKLKEATEHLMKAGFKVGVIDNSMALEWSKLLDLCWYGLNIAFWQGVERILTDPIDLKTFREFEEMINKNSEGKAPRAVHYGGYIGGHCVVPAMEKMIGYLSCVVGTRFPLLEDALISNIRRKEELTWSKPPHHP